MRVIRYSTNVAAASAALRAAIARELTDNRFAEVEQLISACSYRAAIALSGVILEHSLRELATRRDVVVMAAEGAELPGSTPEVAGAHVRDEIDKWAKVVRFVKMRGVRDDILMSYSLQTAHNVFK